MRLLVLPSYPLGFSVTFYFMFPWLLDDQKKKKKSPPPHPHLPDFWGSLLVPNVFAARRDTLRFRVTGRPILLLVVEGASFNISHLLSFQLLTLGAGLVGERDASWQEIQFLLQGSHCTLFVNLLFKVFFLPNPILFGSLHFSLFFQSLQGRGMRT